MGIKKKKKRIRRRVITEYENEWKYNGNTRKIHQGELGVSINVLAAVVVVVDVTITYNQWGVRVTMYMRPIGDVQVLW